MRIKFKTEDMKKLCESSRDLKKQYGQARARKLQKRLLVLKDAPCLEDVPHTPPERRHQLKGNRDEEFAVNIDGPWRIIFKLDHTDVPRKEDGGIDIKQVTSIVILNVCEDYHK